ncbi:MAG: cupin domain-containing protein [Chloroflexi bacterium]|nr:cupin domain-containing protein [Chloroflexota bacterium]
MVERTSERRKEPEPALTAYEQQMRNDNEKLRKKMLGKVIVKGKDVPWEQGRQGLIRFYVWDENWDEMGTPYWRIFINHIKKHSGKHIHQGGLCIYVLEGKGYSTVDGVRYDWEEDDLIVLPIKPDGVEHQHFNLDPGGNAYWMAFIYMPMQEQAGVEFVQVQDHPDWVSRKAGK